MMLVAIVITSFGPGVDAPGEVDDDVTLTLMFQRPIYLEDPGVGARDHVDLFKALTDDVVDHGFPASCAKMLRDILIFSVPRNMKYSVMRYRATHPHAWST